MPLLLENKTALVCGVANAKSIAWGVAQSLQKAGCRVAMSCLASAERRVAKLAEGHGGFEGVFPCDVRNDADVSRLLQEVGARFDHRLDILIHSIASAKLEELGQEFIQTSRDGWSFALDVSAYSLVALSRAARPLLIAAGGGSVVAITYAGSTRVVPSYNVMGVAKAALECSVRYLSYDLGPDKIRVNAVSSGPIETMSSVVIDRFGDSLTGVQEKAPLLECVTPEDVGNACVFLSSDLARMTTGTVLFVDSGADVLNPASDVHPRVVAARKAAQAAAGG